MRLNGEIVGAKNFLPFSFAFFLNIVQKKLAKTEIVSYIGVKQAVIDLRITVSKDLKCFTLGILKKLKTILLEMLL